MACPSLRKGGHKQKSVIFHPFPLKPRTYGLALYLAQIGVADVITCDKFSDNQLRVSCLQ